MELYVRIAGLLPTHDLRSYVRTCSALHDAGASILYHALKVRRGNARQRLTALLLRVMVQSSTHIRCPPVLFLRKLQYSGMSPQDDLRAIPLLCDVLRYAHSLRYLHIEVHPQSAGPLVNLLRRRELARVSISGASLAFDFPHGTYSATTLTLPLLQCLRGSSFEVLGALAAHRHMQSLVLDGIASRGHFIRLLERLSNTAASDRVVALTCTVLTDHVAGFIRAVAEVFPRLQYLNIVVAALPPHDHEQTLVVTEVRVHHSV